MTCSYTVKTETTVQIKYNNHLYIFQSYFILNFILTEPKLAQGPVKFPVCPVSHFAMNIIMVKTCSTTKVNTAKCHNFSNLPGYLPAKISDYTIL